MIKLNLTILGVLLLTGCGPSGKKPERLPPMDVITDAITASTPLLLKKQFTTCEENAFQADQFDIFLNLFLQGSTERESRNFETLFRGLLIGDENKAVVTKTVYNEDQEFIPRGNYSFIEVKQHSNGKEVSVCPGVSRFDRNSVESAALNATYFINKTNAAVTRAHPEVKLRPIKLTISPKIRTTFRIKEKPGKTKSLYRTDNASYSPTEEKIIFLPHSPEWRKANGEMSFWEVPMVSSHEYGHHIFQALVKPANSSSIMAHNCFGTHESGIVESSTEKKISPIMDDKQTIISAFNEGFADLISYYSLSDNERMVTGVKCLQVTRDVGSSTFYDGVEKIFSQEALTTFLTPSPFFKITATGCELTTFQSIHNIGAIFAHNADKIVSLVTESKDTKLKITLEWARSLKSSEEKLSYVNKEEYMRELFVLFIRTALAQTNSILDHKICEQAESSFPSINEALSECTTLE